MYDLVIPDFWYYHLEPVKIIQIEKDSILTVNKKNWKRTIQLNDEELFTFVKTNRVINFYISAIESRNWISEQSEEIFFKIYKSMFLKELGIANVHEDILDDNMYFINSASALEKLAKNHFKKINQLPF